ncbi:MAG: hypothetical protein HY215_05405 [Candidatus Rokubacteria bacterium]|nr:hypothetical protein [Candidatus Rokubacteria bacterium]
MRTRSLLVGITLLGLVGGAAAAPPDEAIIPFDKYTTEKGKTLATMFGSQLRQILNRVHNCRPWLNVPKAGLGFTRAVGMPGDDRYLNIWVRVHQTTTAEFAGLSTERRASAMFSRHGVDLLRQLAADDSIFADPALHGYSVILSWLKPNGGGANPEKEETLGVFTDKATVRAFLAKRMGGKEFVERATIVAFDGSDRLGRIPLEIWEDDFARTFKLPNYEPEDKNVRC